MDSSSWSSDNFTYSTNFTNENEYTVNCEEITNHWMFLIFSGYLLPLISPRIRNFLKETLNGCKKSEIGGKLVTLTEFGFEKVQSIENNKEMKEFIKRMCNEKKIEYNEETIERISWLFSGEKDDNHASIQQTWQKLNKMINSISINKRP